jgi:hypothetical protein
LLLLLGQCAHALLQVAAPTLILVERDDRPEVGIGEPLDLLLQVRPATAQRLAAREKLLRQPGTTMGTRDGHGERFRLTQQGAQVLPYQLV